MATALKTESKCTLFTHSQGGIKTKYTWGYASSLLVKRMQKVYGSVRYRAHVTFTHICGGRGYLLSITEIWVAFTVGKRNYHVL